MGETIQTQQELVKQALSRAEELNAQREDSGEIDGYKITAEQCRAINVGERWAVDKFFAENNLRLKRLAKTFLLRNCVPLYWDKKLNCWQPAVLEVGDCLNQLYVDMRRGFLVFALVPKIISRIICHSFRYAGVGGFGDEDGVYIRGVA